MDPIQTARLLLIQFIHPQDENHQYVYRMEDCIPLEVVVSAPGVQPVKLQTRECCFKCFSAHEKDNPRGPHDCEVRTKTFFRAVAKQWRWCRQERISDPKAADIPRRWQNCGQTIFRKCVDSGDEDCCKAARKLGAHNITKIIQEIVTGIKSFDDLAEI